jgi:cytochrome c2
LAADSAPPPSSKPDWIELDFPFHSSVVEVPGIRTDDLPPSLTPRGLVLNLGAGCWAAFDVDLLRLTAVWQGAGLTPVALAPGSHLQPNRSTPGGQKPAPEPMGKLWLANGLYPGWQIGEQPEFSDPRSPAPSPEEVGRGPLPESVGRLAALHHVADGVVLEYRVGDTQARERLVRTEHDGRPVIERHVRVEPSRQTVLLIGGRLPRDADPGSLRLGLAQDEVSAPPVSAASADSVHYIRIAPRDRAVEFCLALSADGPAPVRRPLPPAPAAPARWTGEITTHVTPAAATGPYVLDDIPLPLANPWRRDVRLADVQFLSDGTAFGVTLDGDVWRIRGLASADGVVWWRRFASGLHEPMSLAIRDDEVFVFDRNGIWRLRDADGDGEAEAHELFSNAFAQTADMREFPNGIRLAPDGSFVVAKGGQQATTLGKHNGSVLRVLADGRRVTVLGYGFRQPFIGVNPQTGLVTASDQQGQYIPTTPLHEVRDGQFHGFLSNLEPREQYPAPIAEPLVWIPHAVNASGASQVWLHGAKLGPLNGALLHFGFNRPEVFRVLFSARSQRRQAAVVSVTQSFDFPPLAGAVNPADGQLYIAGFQILGWGTTATRVAGLARLRYTGATVTLPREAVATTEGVLLRFDTALDPARAADSGSYRLASWHYQRTYKYGSPQLRADGTAGVDWLPVRGVRVARDGRGVLIATELKTPLMQLRVGWTLTATDGTRVEGDAYLSPYELAPIDVQSEGFGPLTPAAAVAASMPVPAEAVTAEAGRRLAQLFGCAACHSTDGSSHASIGPTWRGLFGSIRPLAGNREAVADAAYLRESILDPPAKVLKGYQRTEYAMPSYAGVLSDSQINSLILFIESLR